MYNYNDKENAESENSSKNFKRRFDFPLDNDYYKKESGHKLLYYETNYASNLIDAVWAIFNEKYYISLLTEITESEFRRRFANFLEFGYDNEKYYGLWRE